jgi:hypothetical protein
MDVHSYVASKKYTDGKYGEVTSQLVEKAPKKKTDVWVDVKEGFNAKGDGTTDDTTPIQNALNSLTSGGTVFFPDGTYKVSKAGTFTLAWTSTTKPYAFLIEGKSNIRIVFGKNAKIVFNLDDALKHNVFVVKDCENIEIIGVKGEGIGTTLTHDLYNAAVVLITNSKNVLVENSWSHNVGHNTIALQSRNVKIKNGFAYRDTTLNTGAWFGLYASHNSIISGCVSYGGTGDGDLGIFGGDSLRCIIEDCYAFNYYYGDTTRTIVSTGAQGLYVDSGGRDCIVRNNYLYGYYYGIDIKTNSENTLVQGNIVERCMVAITGRLGEGNQTLNNLMVKDNIIKPNGGNGRPSFNINGITVPIGVFLQDCYGASIDGNLFANSVDINAQADFVSILQVLPSNVTDGYQVPTNIVNNQFNFENRSGALKGSSIKEAIILQGTSSGIIFNVNITNNSFDLYYGGTYPNIIKATYVQNLKISNNNFSEEKGDYCIYLDTCRGVSIQNNNWRMHNGLVNALNTRGISFTGNNHFESNYGVGRSTLKFDGCLNVGITANISYRSTGALADDVYFEMLNTSDWFVVTGNLLDLANKGTSNWNTVVGTNNVIANNLIV